MPNFWNQEISMRSAWVGRDHGATGLGAPGRFIMVAILIAVAVLSVAGVWFLVALVREAPAFLFVLIPGALYVLYSWKRKPNRPGLSNGGSGSGAGVPLVPLPPVLVGQAYDEFPSDRD